jgi:hypothetical protein
MEVFLLRMLTSFLLCCLQVCRLPFFPYVITLVFAAAPSTGERIGQESEKTPTGVWQYKAARWKVEPVSLRSAKIIRHLR